MQVIECPQCGAPAAPNARSCTHCRSAFVVENLAYLRGFDRPGIEKYVAHFKRAAMADSDDGQAAFPLGLCYLGLGNYTLAEKQLKQAVDDRPDFADSYYYYSLALIKGRPLRTLSLSDVRRVEELLSTACQLDESKSKYDYLLALIKREYYRTNGLRVAPPFEMEMIQAAGEKAQEPGELERLLSLVPVRDEEMLSVFRSVAD